MEDWVRRELLDLGFAPELDEVSGGVRFQTDAAGLAHASRSLGCALFISWEIGRFRARAFGELVRKATELPWGAVLGPDARLKVQAKVQRCRLRHTGAIAERIILAASEATGHPGEALTSADEARPPTLVRVLAHSDTFTIAVDTSGEPLRRRGWRPDVGKAPLREDIARALLLEAGVGRERYEVVWDPFCGSGTLPIEAAVLLEGRPPGALRSFTFQSFPGFAALPQPPAEEARSHETEIWASDRDAGAVARALGNAERAGAELKVFEAPLGKALQAGWFNRRGLLVANPPYGARVGKGPDLRRLYAALGEVARSLPQWEVALVSPDTRLVSATGLPLKPRLRTDHGGRAVTLYTTGPG